MKPRYTSLVYIQKDRLIFTSKIITKKVNDIADNFDPKLYTPSTGFLKNGMVTITDGNHRAKALIKRGEDFIPFALLTKKEFDHVKYSDRKAPLMVNMPTPPLYYPSFHIVTTTGPHTQRTTSFPLYAFPKNAEKKKIFAVALGGLLKDDKFRLLHEEHGTTMKIEADDIKSILNL